MLAYLDGILEPQDAEDIAKKIEESAFASELIRRIRDLMHRPGSTSPADAPQGPSLGPNTMAEYLDNTLSPDRVTEFEKICLDSDIHLAEVSSCHQILTLVLGEPAEIDPAARQRMYDIIAKAKAAEIPFSSDSLTEIVMPPPLPSFSVASTDAESGRKTRSKPGIPEYLREPEKNYRWVSYAGISIAAICLLIAIFIGLGQFKPGTLVGNMLVGMGIINDNKQVALETSKAVAQPAKTGSDLPANEKTEEKTAAAEPKATPEPAEKTTIAATSPPPAEAEKPSGVEKPADDAKPSEKALPETNPETTSTAEKPLEQTETPAAITTPADQGEKQGDLAPKELVLPAPGPVAGEPGKTGEDSGEAKPAEEKALPPAERLGRYMSDDQILLGSSGPTADWQRLASKEFISAHEQLLALPTHRVDITVGGGINLRMLGGTQLELLPANAKEPAGVKIRFGRIVAMPLANGDTKIRIVFGNRSGVITFADPEAVVAAEIQRIHAPGTNPETTSAKYKAVIFVTTGHALWDDGEQKTLEIAGPAYFTLTDQLKPELTAAKELPKWISEVPISRLDRSASEIITQTLLDLPANRPAQRSLMELAEHRRKEVRWLAVRCLGYLGYFDPMVMVLDNVEFKSDWGDNVDQLCQAVARDGETAAQVRKTLENRYPQISAEMYRMLWSYSDKDLESGEDAKLVKLLDNENLPLRVLSFWNLREITGKGLYYQPEQTLAKRQQPVLRWRKSLENKEIRIMPVEEKVGAAAGEETVDTP
jgi:hypothetical protein